MLAKRFEACSTLNPYKFRTIPAKMIHNTVVITLARLIAVLYFTLALFEI